jgi:hypothetical protein
MDTRKKVRDLPHNNPENLVGLKLKTKRGVIGYYVSEFSTGVMLNDNPDVINKDRLYPQIFEKREDILDWEICNDEDQINCHKLTTLEHILNIETIY